MPVPGRFGPLYAFIAVGWKDDRLVGIEILDTGARLLEEPKSTANTAVS